MIKISIDFRILTIDIIKLNLCKFYKIKNKNKSKLRKKERKEIIN